MKPQQKFVVVKDPGEPARIETVDVSWTDTQFFRSIQKWCGGCIERLPLAPRMDMWFKDDGRLRFLAPNLVIPGSQHPIAVVGTAVVAWVARINLCGTDRETAMDMCRLLDAHAATPKAFHAALAAEQRYLDQLAKRPRVVVIR